MPKTSSQVTPISIWGKVITELRNNNAGILFVACGEVTEVKLTEKTFVIYANDSDKSIIEVPQNFEILQNTVAKYLPNYDIVIESDQNSEENRKLQVLKLSTLIIFLKVIRFIVY